VTGDIARKPHNALVGSASAQPRRRLLLVAYSFPPVGGAGVQRPVKWVKNLGQFGWDVTVLTPENPSVPTRDESLFADIPDDVLIVRARTWEPDYQSKQAMLDKVGAEREGFMRRAKVGVKKLVRQTAKLALQPDPQILWVPNAIRAARKVLSEIQHDAILVTAPAYSSFFIGTSLKRRFKLPLIMDFRDEWDLSGRYLENAQRDNFSRIVQERMQRYVLRRADAIVATTHASTANLAEKLSRLNRSGIKAVTIFNGFDAEDFSADKLGRAVLPTKSVSSSTYFRLLYTGTLWNLTTIEPLVAAILQLERTAPELVATLELVCVGRKTPEQIAILERLRGCGCRLELIDYCAHAEVLGWLQSANAVCLLLSDVPGAERVVPAKLFEYLAIRRDILAIMPNGEAADIVKRFFPVGHFAPNDIDAIAGWLKGRLSGEMKSNVAQIANGDINEFDRVSQTGRLAMLLNEVAQQKISPIEHQSASA
jgi:glycosyltransferase involved in cell wall biosynthesis